MDSNFEYFNENLENLFSEYGSKFIAIKNKKVLGSYDSFEEALLETLKFERMGTFLIQQCTNDAANFTFAFQSNIKYLQ